MSARFHVVVTTVTLMSCTSEPTPARDAGSELCDAEPIQGAIDVGIRCANLFAGVELMTSEPDATLVVSTLPDGVELEYFQPTWFLTGRLPDTDFAIDASFVATLTDPPSGDEACERVTLFDVRFIIDSCESPRVCDASFSAFPIDGFCVPGFINANAAFTVTPITSECLSSSCIEEQPTGCDVVVAGNQVSIGGTVCTRELDVECTECGNFVGGPCIVPPLAPGEYVLSSSGGTLTIEVPRDTEDHNVSECVSP